MHDECIYHNVEIEKLVGKKKKKQKRDILWNTKYNIRPMRAPFAN